VDEEVRRQELEAQRIASEREQELRQGVTVARAQQPPAPRQLARSLGELASWLVTQQRTSEARELFDEALSLVTDGSLESDTSAFQLQIMLADLCESDHQPELVVHALRAAVDLAARHPSALSPQVREAVERLLHAHGYESETNDLMDRLLKLRGVPVANSISPTGTTLSRRSGSVPTGGRTCTSACESPTTSLT
jgi:hypothetical protein